MPISERGIVAYEHRGRPDRAGDGLSSPERRSPMSRGGMEGRGHRLRPFGAPANCEVVTRRRSSSAASLVQAGLGGMFQPRRVAGGLVRALRPAPRHGRRLLVGPDRVVPGCQLDACWSCGYRWVPPAADAQPQKPRSRRPLLGRRPSSRLAEPAWGWAGPANACTNVTSWLARSQTCYQYVQKPHTGVASSGFRRETGHVCARTGAEPEPEPAPASTTAELACRGSLLVRGVPSGTAGAAAEDGKVPRVDRKAQL
jgi:hypothetical protein